MKASEFLEMMQKDEDYQLMKKKEEAYFSKIRKIYAKDERTLLEELKSVGIEISSVWDLRNSSENYIHAEAILVRHLREKHYPKTLAGIARSLATPVFSQNEELWEILLNLYRTTLPNAKIKKPVKRGLQEAVAVALEALATRHRVSSLIDLISEYPEGDGMCFIKDAVESFDLTNK